MHWLGRSQPGQYHFLRIAIAQKVWGIRVVVQEPKAIPAYLIVSAPQTDHWPQPNRHPYPETQSSSGYLRRGDRADTWVSLDRKRPKHVILRLCLTVTSLAIGMRFHSSIYIRECSPCTHLTISTCGSLVAFFSITSLQLVAYTYTCLKDRIQNDFPHGSERLSTFSCKSYSG